MSEEPGRLPGDPVGLAAAATLGLLCLVVAGVGGVAVGAELLNTWGHYFVMERAVAAATPVTVWLAGAAIVAGLAAVARTA